jgi:hypothetical protein
MISSCDLLNADASRQSNVAIKTADGRYLQVLSARQQWVYAGSPRVEDAALFRVTPIDGGKFALQFSQRGKDRDGYLFQNTCVADDGSKNPIWASAPTPGVNTHFTIEDLEEGYVHIRAFTGKLLVPVNSGEVEGHLQATGFRSDLATRIMFQCAQV